MKLTKIPNYSPSLKALRSIQKAKDAYFKEYLKQLHKENPHEDYRKLCSLASKHLREKFGIKND